MAVSRDDVRAVARMARLRLDDDEIERFTGQLNRILEHVETLAELDLEASEGVAGAVEARAPLRPDDIGPDTLDRPVAALAPAWEDGFFTVPRLAALDGDGEGDPAGGGAAGGDS